MIYYIYTTFYWIILKKNNKLPEIDKVFVNSCMKILCNESASGRPPKKEIKELKDKLTRNYMCKFIY